MSVAATLSACGSGCALFDTGGWTAANLGTARQTLLKPITDAAPEALRLEYVILERPIGDPLLGDELWLDLVEIGLFEPAVRESLNDHGIRVGVTSSSPPDALRQLLGETIEIDDGSAPDEARRRGGQMLVLPSGGQTEAQTSDVLETCLVNVTVGGELESKTFENARGVFQVTASSKQEGWATFEFLPEIHHGAAQTRPVAGRSGWQQFQTGQEVQKLYEQRFTLTLNEGDAAVITSVGDDPLRAGRLFFHTTADGIPVQRLLVVRLVRTGESPQKK